MLTAISAPMQQERLQVPYQNLSEKFLIKQKVFTQQYAGLYFWRLNVQRQKILENISYSWAKLIPEPKHIDRIISIKEKEVCYIIGTVFQEMSLKPTILDEITREAWVQAPPPKDKYFSESDTYILEDESGRVKLVGDILKTNMLVTGN